MVLRVEEVSSHKIQNLTLLVLQGLWILAIGIYCLCAKFVSMYHMKNYGSNE